MNKSLEKERSFKYFSYVHCFQEMQVNSSGHLGITFDYWTVTINLLYLWTICKIISKELQRIQQTFNEKLWVRHWAWCQENKDECDTDAAIKTLKC